MKTKNRSIPLFAKFKTKLALCALLVITADFFFYDEKAGFTIGVFCFALLASVAATCKPVLRTTTGRLLTLALTGLCAVMVHHVEPLAFFLFFVGLFGLVSYTKHGFIPSYAQWIANTFRALGRTITGPSVDNRKVRALRTSSQKEKIDSSLIIAQFALPLLFTVLFCVLFADANPDFAKLFDYLDFDFSIPSFSRFVFAAFVGLIVWLFLRPRFKITHTGMATPENVAEGFFSKASVIISLFVFNLIFAIQNLLDMDFLLSGLNNMDAQRNFAAYARDSAHPLVFTAMLAAFYVLLVFGNKGKYQTKLSRKLVYVWIVQNLVLLGMAATRLCEYVAHYSLTTTRLSTFIWMGLVATGFVLVVVRIVKNKNNRWLINANFVSLVAVLYVCSTLNFNAIIANYNVNHSKIFGGTHTLDIGYLYRLNDPAVLPALYKYRARLDENPEFDNSIKKLEGKALYRFDRNWRTWTWHLYSLNKTITKHNTNVKG